MATKTELVGGAFQDSQGNLLVDGYLKMRLSQDSEVNDSIICAGIEVTIQLDANGDAVAGQFVWGNDVLLPVNSFYIVTGYTAKGQPAWGPNNQQVLSNSYGLFDLGSWVPNQVFVWTPPPQPVSLEINGVPASSQTVQNLVDSATITFVDNGGGNITADGAPPVTPGFALSQNNWFMSTQSFVGCGLSLANDSRINLGEHGDVCKCVQVNLPVPITIHKISISVVIAGSPGNFMLAGLYSADGVTKLIDAGNNAFDTSTIGVKTVTLGTPVVLPAGSYLVAHTGSNTATPRAVGYDQVQFYTAEFAALINANANRYVYASVGQSGGNLPASLGAFTSASVQTFDIPMVLFE
jgi:hypothetical protein